MILGFLNGKSDKLSVFLFSHVLGVRLPAGNRSIYGYFVGMEDGNFVPWDILIPSTKSLIEKGAVITIGNHQLLVHVSVCLCCCCLLFFNICEKLLLVSCCYYVTYFLLLKKLRSKEVNVLYRLCCWIKIRISFLQ